MNSDENHKKRHVFCFDGTWNRLDAPNPTNVVLTAESVLPLSEDGIAQIVYYDEGVGTGKYDEIAGGVFGIGLTKNLADAYRHLIFNHTPGDAIYIFGFSRGAFTARSFAGLLATFGIVDRSKAGRANEVVKLYRRMNSKSAPSAEEIACFRADVSRSVCASQEDDAWRCQNIDGYQSGTAPLISIAYLGVWDTVGALGVPKRHNLLGYFNRDLQFHDTRLNTAIASARHAVALDETRLDFAPTLWDDVDRQNKDAGYSSDADDAPYQQRWFPGVHGSVGGGGDFRGLSDLTLAWIWDGARLAKLALDTSQSSRIYSLLPDFLAPIDNNNVERLTRWQRITSGAMNFVWRRAARSNGPNAIHQVSVSARRRWHAEPQDLPEGEKYRPKTLRDVGDILDKDVNYARDFERPAPGTFDVVIVKRGDTLTGISYGLYKDAQYAQAIFEMNRDKLDDPDRIYAGMSLLVHVRTDSTEGS